MTGYVGGVRPANREQPIKRSRPRRHIGVGIDRRIGRLLDEITAEDHDPAAVITRHHHDQVRVGVAAPQVRDGHLAVPEVDDGSGGGVLGRPQRRDRAVDLIGVGSVA